MEKEQKQRIIDQKRKKVFNLTLLVAFVVVVSAMSSILADKYIFPWMATRSFFEKYTIFKKGMENVMVINKTEQVTVNEDQAISEYTGKSAASIVEIVSKSAVRKFSSAEPIASKSGLIVTADGLIATYGEKFFESNNSEYRVFLADNRSYNARVVIRDSFSNLVLLKLDDAQNLPAVEFIASEDIKVGVRAIVIGRSGFNKEASFRLGITSEWEKALSISGSLASSEKLQGVLSFNSDLADSREEGLVGGGVADFNGNIIGVLGEKKEDTGMNFFIIPANHLQYIIDQYLQKGKIDRASLGVYYILLSDESAFAWGINLNHGALVYSASGQQGLAVISGSAAERAGIKIMDVILSVNGEEVNPNQNLSYLISKYKSGDEIELKIFREGKEMTIRVDLQ